MADVEKKMAAALAAVSMYLQQEEAACQHSADSLSQAQQPQQALSLWGHSGRQEMMTMRNLIQMRAFGRLR